MKKKLAALPSVLKELLLGILICGGIMQAAFIWFASDKLLFTSGLWLGVLGAALMAVHMYQTLDEGLYMADAEKYIRRGYAKRYSMIIVCTMAIAYLGIGNLLAFFLGLLTLKFSAYMQPMMHKVLTKKKKGG